MKRGDKVSVEGVVTGFNVGGEVRADFGHAYGSPSGELWVKTARPIEPFRIRLRRRLARLLQRWSGAISPDKK